MRLFAPICSPARGSRLEPPTGSALFAPTARSGSVLLPAVGECAMSLGLILIILVILYLLGGLSGRFGGYGYGMGHSGIGLGGVVLVVLLVLVLLGKI